MSAIVNATSPFAYASPLGRLLDKDLALRFSACLAALRAAQCRTGSLDAGSVCGSAPIDAKDLFYNIFRYLCSSGGGTPFYVPFDVASDGTPDVEGQIKSAQPYRVWWAVFNHAVAYLLSSSRWCLSRTPNGSRIFSPADIPALAWRDTSDAAEYALPLSNSAPWLCTVSDVDLSSGFFGDAYAAPHGNTNTLRSVAVSRAVEAGFDNLFPTLPSNAQIAAWALSFARALPSYWRGDNSPAIQDGQLKQLSSASSSTFYWRDEFPYHGLCALVAALDFFESARDGLVWLTASYAGYDTHYLHTSRTTSYIGSIVLNYNSQTSGSISFGRSASDTTTEFFASRPYPYVRRTLQTRPSPTVAAYAALPLNVTLASGLSLQYSDAGSTYIIFNALAPSAGFFSQISASSTADDIAALINAQIDSAVAAAYDGGVNVSVSFALSGSIETIDTSWAGSSSPYVYLQSDSRSDIPDNASCVALARTSAKSAILKGSQRSLSSQIFAELHDEAGGTDAPSPPAYDLSASAALQGLPAVLPYGSHVSVVFDDSRRLWLYQTAGEASSATPYVEIPMPMIYDESGTLVFPTGGESFGDDFALRIAPGPRPVPVSVSVNASGAFDSYDISAQLQSLSAFFSRALPARQIAAPGYY